MTSDMMAGEETSLRSSDFQASDALSDQQRHGMRRMYPTRVPLVACFAPI